MGRHIPQLANVAKIIADEYFLCVGYIETIGDASAGRQSFMTDTGRITSEMLQCEVMGIFHTLFRLKKSKWGKVGEVGR